MKPKHWASIATVIGASLFSLPAQDAQKIERGRYLVEEVARCQDCHTQRLETGELDKTRWMKGAVLDFAPLKPVQGWHKTSPDLTPEGRLWQRWGEANITKYLQTGLNPNNNKPADPPMPAYKVSPADAEAMVAYLKSIKNPPPQ